MHSIARLPGASGGGLTFFGAVLSYFACTYCMYSADAHSFIVGNDGSIEMVGYDVSARFDKLVVGGNIDFIAASGANLTFSQDYSKFLIANNSAHSLFFGTSPENKILEIATTTGEEFVRVYGSLAVSGDVDLSSSPTTITIKGNESHALDLVSVETSKSLERRGILSVNTSGIVPQITVDGSIVSHIGVQSLAEFFNATLAGCWIPPHTSVAQISSSHPNHAVVLPDRVSIGHTVRLLNHKNSFLLRAATSGGSINAYRATEINITSDKAIIDCTLITIPNEWVCLSTDVNGRQDPSKVVRVSEGIIFSAAEGSILSTTHLRIKDSPSTDRLIYLPDESGTIITTGNLHDINGRVTSLSVSGDLRTHGNVVLGDGEDDNIVLHGAIQNWNVPIARGISSTPSPLVTVSIMDHGIVRGTKVVLYGVEGGGSALNGAYTVDQPTANTVVLKTYNGFEYVSGKALGDGPFSGGHILPLQSKTHRVQLVTFVDSRSIQVNVTVADKDSLSSECVVLLQSNQVMWGPFNVTRQTIIDAPTLRLDLTTSQAIPGKNIIEYFDTLSRPNMVLSEANCSDQKPIAVGVTNSSVAIVTTELPHGLEDNETIRISGTKGLVIPDTTYKARVLSPHRFCLHSASTAEALDTSTSAFPGYGGHVFRSKALEFVGNAAAGDVKTSFSIVAPSRNRTIHLPDADGTIITTGNLHDVTASNGSFTSLRVSGPLTANGSTSFGTSREDTSIWYNSVRARGNAVFGHSLDDAIHFRGKIQPYGDEMVSVNATLGGGIMIATKQMHSLRDGDTVFIGGAKGVPTINNQFFKVDSSRKLRSFLLDGAKFADLEGVYTGGGAVTRALSGAVVQIKNKNGILQQCKDGMCDNVVVQVASNQFSAGDVVIIVGNNRSLPDDHSPRSLERRTYGYTLCTANATTLTLCDTSRQAFHLPFHWWTGGWVIRISTAVFANVTIDNTTRRACFEARNQQIEKGDIVTLGNTPKPTRAAFEVMGVDSDCLILHAPVDFNSTRSQNVYLSKVGGETNAYKALSSATDGSLHFEVNRGEVDELSMQPMDVIVTFGDTDAAELSNGRAHMIREWYTNTSGALFFSVHNSTPNQLHFNDSRVGGYFVRVSLPSPPPGTVLTFASKSTPASLTHLALPTGATGTTIISLPSVSGTVITTGNLEHIEIDRLSSSFPDDVAAAGDVSLGSDPEDEITLVGTIKNVVGQGHALAFEGSTKDDHKLYLNVEDPVGETSIVLPDTSGVVITTGNLEDITGIGELTNVTVTHSLTVQGNSYLGNDDNDVTAILGAVNIETNASSTDTVLSVSADHVRQGSLVSLTAESMANEATLLKLTTETTNLTNGAVLDIHAEEVQTGDVALIKASALTSGSALRVVHTGHAPRLGNLVEFSSTGDLHEGGGVLLVAGNSIRQGRVAAFHMENLQSGIGVEISSLSGDAMTSTGSLLKIAGNHQTHGTIASIQGRDMTTGTLLSLTNNEKLTSGKIMHISTTSASAANPVLIESAEITTGKLVSLQTENLINGTILDVRTSDGSTSTSASTLVRLSAGTLQAGGTLLDIDAKNMHHGTGLYVHSENVDFDGELFDVVSHAKHCGHGVVSVKSVGPMSGTVVNVTGSKMAGGSVLYVSTNASAFENTPEAALASFVATNSVGGTVVRIDAPTLSNGTLLALSGPSLRKGTGMRISGGEAMGTVGTLMHLETNASFSSTGALVSIDTPNLETGTLMRIHVPSLVSGAGLQITGGGNMTHDGALMRIHAKARRSGPAIDVDVGAGTAFRITGSGTLLNASSTLSSLPGTDGLVSISADSLKDGKVFSISANTLGSGGRALKIVSNSNALDGLVKLRGKGTILRVVNDNQNMGVGHAGLILDVDVGECLRIESYARSGNVLDIDMSRKSVGNGIHITSSRSSGSASLISLRQEYTHYNSTGLHIVNGAVGINDTDSSLSHLTPGAALVVESDLQNVVYISSEAKWNAYNARITVTRSGIEQGDQPHMIGRINFESIAHDTEERMVFAQVKAVSLAGQDDGEISISIRNGAQLQQRFLLNSLGYAELGEAHNHFALTRPDKQTAGSGSNFEICGQNSTIGKGGNVVFRVGRGDHGSDGNITFQKTNSTEYSAYVDNDKLSVNVPSIDSISQGVRWTLKSPDESVQLNMKDSSGREVTVASTGTDGRQVSINCGVSVANNMFVKGDAALAHLLNLTNATGTVIIPGNKKQAFTIKTKSGTPMISVDTELETTVSVRGNVKARRVYGLRSKLVHIRREDLVESLSGLNLEYYVSASEAGRTYIFNIVSPGKEIFVFLPSIGVVGASFTFKFLKMDRFEETNVINKTHFGITFVSGTNLTNNNAGFNGLVEIKKTRVGDNSAYSLICPTESDTISLQLFHSRYSVRAGSYVKFTAVDDRKDPLYFYEGELNVAPSTQTGILACQFLSYVNSATPSTLNATVVPEYIAFSFTTSSVGAITAGGNITIIPLQSEIFDWDGSVDVTIGGTGVSSECEPVHAYVENTSVVTLDGDMCRVANTGEIIVTYKGGLKLNTAGRKEFAMATSADTNPVIGSYTISQQN